MRSITGFAARPTRSGGSPCSVWRKLSASKRMDSGDFFASSWRTRDMSPLTSVASMRPRSAALVAACWASSTEANVSENFCSRRTMASSPGILTKMLGSSGLQFFDGRPPVDGRILRRRHVLRVVLSPRLNLLLLAHASGMSATTRDSRKRSEHSRCSASMTFGATWTDSARRARALPRRTYGNLRCVNVLAGLRWLRGRTHTLPQRRHP